MKNYYLIGGALIAGVGFVSIMNNREIEKIKSGKKKIEDVKTTNGENIFSVIGGVALVVIGLTAFKK